MTLNQITSEVLSIITASGAGYYPSPTPQVSQEISAASSASLNNYVNNLIGTGRAFFNPAQMNFINMLIGPAIKSNIPVFAINNYILDVEDNITKSNLTTEDAMPLLLATTIGENAWMYWTGDIAAGTPKWTSYYLSQQAENYANVPHFVESAIIGALVGYGANIQGQIEPNTDNITTRMVAALIGALTVNAAKVALQLIPRIQASCVAAMVTTPLNKNNNNLMSFDYRVIRG